MFEILGLSQPVDGFTAFQLGVHMIAALSYGFMLGYIWRSGP